LSDQAKEQLVRGVARAKKNNNQPAKYCAIITHFVFFLTRVQKSSSSKPSSLSEATAEKLTSNKLNNNRDIYIDSEDDFEGSGRKGEVRKRCFVCESISGERRKWN
jgi:hypothetical protein